MISYILQLNAEYIEYMLYFSHIVRRTSAEEIKMNAITVDGIGN